MARLLTLSLTLLFLAACSFAPLRYNVDLLDELPDQTSGSFTLDTSVSTLDLLPLLTNREGSFRQNLPVGGVDVPLSVTLPTSAGQLIDLTNEPLPVTLEDVTVRYTLVLTSENLSGALEVQPYLAPAGGDAVNASAYALGEPQRVALGETSTLQAEVSLNEAQLRGVNDRSLRLALGVDGEAGVTAAGEVALGYEFSELSIDIGEVGAGTNTRLPDADGEALDFTDVDVPGPGRLIGAKLDYDLRLTHDADASGTLTAQVYVAPPGEETLWQEKFLFDQQSVDMRQQEVDVAGQASLNADQRPLLGEQRLRIGVRISGDAAANLSEEGDEIIVTYEMNRLDLRVSYAL